LHPSRSTSQASSSEIAEQRLTYNKAGASGVRKLRWFSDEKKTARGGL